MWLAGAVMGAASGDASGLTVLVGLLAVAASVVTALLGSRGAWRTASMQRETEFDKRQDQRNVHLEQRNQELEAKAARYRELYFELRIAVIRAGLDPDELLGEEAEDDAER